MVKLLTPGQVAEIFNVSPRSVLRWIQEGRIKGVRTPTGHNRIPLSEVQRYLDAVNLELDAGNTELDAGNTELDAGNTELDAAQ